MTVLLLFKRCHIVLRSLQLNVLLKMLKRIRDTKVWKSIFNLIFLMQRIIICLKRSREGELFKLRSNENYEKICSSPCRPSNCETHILFSFYVTDHQEKTQRLEAIITQSQSQGQIGRQSAAMQLTVPEITRIDCCDTCQVSIFKTILQMWSC